MKKLEGYLHGVNLGGWLSQCNHTKERYDTFIVESDIKTISEWGLDHVRVPVDYNLVEDDEGNYKESGFAYIDKAIEWCGKYGLNMVLDLHKTYGYSFDKGEGEDGFFDSEKYQERFYALWEEFTRRYGKFHSRVIFELLNEVTSETYSDRWNRISTECIKRIHALCPEVKILLGGYWNNSIDAMPDLALPYDENVVYNFHCYEPLVFTHQGAPWVDGMNTSFRMPLESTYADYNKFSTENIEQYTPDIAGFDEQDVMGSAYFEKLVSKAVEVATERNVALYCGEYGVIDMVGPEDTVKWYKLMCGAFDKFGIGRSAWTYKQMDFGISDARLDSVRDELLKII